MPLPVGLLRRGAGPQIRTGTGLCLKQLPPASWASSAWCSEEDLNLQDPKVNGVTARWCHPSPRRCMELPEGFQPPTCGFEARGSFSELREPGAGPEIRTPTERTLSPPPLPGWASPAWCPISDSNRDCAAPKAAASAVGLIGQGLVPAGRFERPLVLAWGVCLCPVGLRRLGARPATRTPHLQLRTLVLFLLS